MNAFRKLLAAFFILAAAHPLRATDAPAPSLDEQIRRAQDEKDKSSLVELYRRRLAVPGASPRDWLALLFQAQLDNAELIEAKATLERPEKATLPPATLAEMRGDLAHAEEGHLDEALAGWRAALAAKPANPAALHGKIADALDNANRWGEAAEAFRASLKAAPNHPARQARLAVCLLNAGRSADADKEIQAAVRADAADETVKGVAPLFDRLRPFQPALKKLEALMATKAPALTTPEDELKALSTSPTGAHLARAYILYRVEAYAGALPDAAYAAHATGGMSLAARLLQAQCLWQLGKDKEAAMTGVGRIADKKWFEDLPRYNRMLGADLAPTLSGAAQVRAYTVRATMLMEINQDTLALADARRASEVNTGQKLRLDDPEVVYAATLLRSDLAKEALAAAKRATEYAPNNPDGWAILGRVEQETRAEYATAAEHLSKALALREEPRWLRRRETCLRTLGRNDEADRDAKRLARIEG